MKKKVLITGASGFVGYHLIEAALQQGLEVHAAVRKTSDIGHLAGVAVQYVYLDFENAAVLKDQLEEGQYDYLVHAAGITKTKNAGDYFRINATYTGNLAVACMEANIPLKKLFLLAAWLHWAL